MFRDTGLTDSFYAAGIMHRARRNVLILSKSKNKKTFRVEANVFIFKLAWNIFVFIPTQPEKIIMEEVAHEGRSASGTQVALSGQT